MGKGHVSREEGNGPQELLDCEQQKGQDCAIFSSEPLVPNTVPGTWQELRKNL